MTGPTIEVQVGDVELLVETTPVAPVVGSELTSKVDDVAIRASEAFARAQTAIVEVATSTVEVMRKAAARAARPDRMEVTFGLKFSANGNVILAGVAGEATLSVKLIYTPSVEKAQS
jgi:hypothetical protein